MARPVLRVVLKRSVAVRGSIRAVTGRVTVALLKLQFLVKGPKPPRQMKPRLEGPSFEPCGVKVRPRLLLNATLNHGRVVELKLPPSHDGTLYETVPKIVRRQGVE